MLFVITMNKLIGTFFFIIVLVCSCASGRKDSYSSKVGGRQFKLKLKDNFSNKSPKRSASKKRRDSYSDTPKRIIKIKWRDSFSGGSGRKRQLGFKDSYGSGRRAKKRKQKKGGRYETSPTKRINFSKRRDSYGSIAGKRKKMGRFQT